MRLDFTVGEPAEGDDFELAAIGGVECVELGAAFGGFIGGVDVIRNSLYDGFAVGSCNHISAGIDGFTAGADAEGVRAGGDGGANDLEDVCLGEPAGDAGGAVALLAFAGGVAEHGAVGDDGGDGAEVVVGGGDGPVWGGWVGIGEWV